MNKKKKSVLIIGAGPAGIFSAYELSKNQNLDIFLVDEGNNLTKRNCVVRTSNKECVHCKTCNITHGFGGAGTFSDCKLSLTPFNVGGDIVDYIGGYKAKKYIKKVDNIFSRFDTDRDKRETIGSKKNNNYKNIERKLKNVGLSLNYCPTKHLGTDGTLDVMTNMYYYLLTAGVKMYFNTKVIKINEDKTIVTDSPFSCNLDRKYDYIIVAVGRSGNTWLSKQAKDLCLKTASDKFDIGVRVEVPYDVTKEPTDELYDMKIYNKYNHNYKCRTFCTNPKGFVSEEHYDDDIVLANGHSYADTKSEYTNFAVLCTMPLHYNNQGINIVKEFNNVTKHKLAVNSFKYAFGFSDENISIDNPNYVTDVRITNYLPKEVNSVLLDFLIKLDKAYPGVFEKARLYALEAKFYSSKIEVNKHFETKIKGLYCIGDGSGITRGITQSASSGLVVANHINKRIH